MTMPHKPITPEIPDDPETRRPPILGHVLIQELIRLGVIRGDACVSEVTITAKVGEIVYVDIHQEADDRVGIALEEAARRTGISGTTMTREPHPDGPTGAGP